jgi:hypothetical protein
MGDESDHVVFEYTRFVVPPRPSSGRNVPGSMTKKLRDGRRISDVLMPIVADVGWEEYYSLMCAAPPPRSLPSPPSAQAPRSRA